MRRIDPVAWPWRKQRPHDRRHGHQENIEKGDVPRRVRIIQPDQHGTQQQHHAVNNLVKEQGSDDFDRLHDPIAQLHTDRQGGKRIIE